MPKRKASVDNPPISFRMPPTLRARLRRFAKERSLGEAEALRLAISEHLNELDEHREIADAERWQLAETLESHRRAVAGDNPAVPWEAVEALFREALADADRHRPT